MMKMKCLYLLVSMAMCWLFVAGDSSEEMIAMYRDGRPVNFRNQNSLSNEVRPIYYRRGRRRHCERIRNVCASNNMIYENYCEFKAARSYEYIRRVECTDEHVRNFYAPDTRPKPVTNRPVPTTREINPDKRVQTAGENGRIDNGVVPEPKPTTMKTVELLTTKACSEVCPLTYEPVCATDGKDYPSLCVFEASKCIGNTNSSVTIDYYGMCADRPTPPTGNLEGFRFCPNGPCEEDINYVCGTDGLTYDNKCKLLKIACAANNSSLHLEYEGECTPLKNTTETPEPEPEPENSSNTTTMEPLPTPKKSVMTTDDPCANPTCKVIWDPICADDGETYPSLCVLENKNLCSNSKVKLTVLYKGECTEATTKQASECLITCPPLVLQPICGTDNTSYPSRCILRKYNCENEAEVEVAYEGGCIEVNRGDTPNQN